MEELWYDTIVVYRGQVRSRLRSQVVVEQLRTTVFGEVAFGEVA